MPLSGFVLRQGQRRKRQRPSESVPGLTASKTNRSWIPSGFD
jgi:hypothetical protein